MSGKLAIRHAQAHVLFSSDTPFEPEPGVYIRETIDIIDRLEITDEVRAQTTWETPWRCSS
jgi:hypothetical protein